MAIEVFNRYEKKYRITDACYQKLRERLLEYMEPDAHSRDGEFYTICNIYYDTPDYRLIRRSLEKPVYKEKLRVRSYGVPTGRDKVFVELKKKFDGVVYKRRITLGANDAARYLSGAPLRQPSQISREIDWFMRSYRPGPKVFIGYDREAYAGKAQSELRITFDTNLRWRDYNVDLRAGDYGNPIIGDNQVLMEIKIPGTAPLWLAHLLSENYIVSTSFSKYGTEYKRFVANGCKIVTEDKKIC